MGLDWKMKTISPWVTLPKIGSLFLLCFGTTYLSAETVQLLAVKDNTLFEEGGVSNGMGSDLFAGRRGVNDPVPNFSDRRAVIQFDLSGIPPGSQIDSVDLFLSVNKTVAVSSDAFAFHRLTRTWGEGQSKASGQSTGGGAEVTLGDATWTHAFHETEVWATPGGDFIQQASATQTIGNVGDYSWAGEGLVSDVQQWVNDSGSNFGWILVGPQDPFLRSVRRFSSRESDFNPPLLLVTYTEGFGLWAGYYIESDGRSVFTDGFLGWIDISGGEWIYVYDLGKYIYLPEENVTEAGGWAWIGK
jgi:hypothetical protein